MAFVVRGTALSDRDSTVIAGNSEPVIVDGDAARALRVWEPGKSGGFSASGFLPAVGDLDGLHVAACRWVPEHDLVVITGGHDLAIAAVSKTPDLTFGVRLHDVDLGLILASEADSAVALSD